MGKKLLAAGLHLTTYLTSRLTEKYEPAGSYYTVYPVTVNRNTIVYSNWLTDRITAYTIYGEGGTAYPNAGGRWTSYYSYGPKDLITTYQSNTSVLTSYDAYYYNDYTYFTVQRWTTW